MSISRYKVNATNNITKCLISSVFFSVVRKQTQHIGRISLPHSFGMTFFHTIASITSYGLVSEVSYPTQLIAKCALPMFAMFSILLFDRKCYSIQRYIFSIVIIAGVVIFVGNSTYTNAGISLIITNLGANGILFGLQEMARKEAEMTHFNVIFATHLGISIVLVCGLCGGLSNGADPAGLRYFFEFLMKYPETLYLIGLLAVVYTIGQLCVCHMLSMFGDKPYSTVMAIRKMCSLMFSIFVFGNALVNRQWIGVALVFTALFGDVALGNVSCKSKQNTNDVNIENGSVALGNN